MLDLPSGKCACSGDNLDRFIQPVILAILAQEPSNGYGVIKKIPQYVTFAESGADPTGVYRYLKILLSKGLIRQPDPVPQAQQVAPYYITEAGLDCLESWVDTLSDYTVKIEQLVQQLKTAEPV